MKMNTKGKYIRIVEQIYRMVYIKIGMFFESFEDAFFVYFPYDCHTRSAVNPLPPPPPPAPPQLKGNNIITLMDFGIILHSYAILVES